MKKVLYLTFLIYLSMVSHVSAAIFFESAQEPFFGSGGVSHIVSDTIWPFHRFQVTEQNFQLTGIGGNFRNHSNFDWDIFGAVVKLNASNDLPNSADLSTSDLLGTTLLKLEGQYPENNILNKQADLFLNLNVGWYALGYGTGAFGASSNTFGIGMPLYIGDSSPGQEHFFAAQNLQAFLPATPHIGDPDPRFFALGEVVENPIWSPKSPKSPTSPTSPTIPTAPVSPTFYLTLGEGGGRRSLPSTTNPEPASMILFGTGLAGVALRKRFAV